MRDALIARSCLVARPGLAQAQVPGAIAAPGENAVATWHAEGAQIYECKAGADGKLAWAFREPIATLLLDGKTIGRHYAGPNWEHMDGSAVVGKAAGNAPGATPKDIPLLKLEVVSSRGIDERAGNAAPPPIGAHRKPAHIERVLLRRAEDAADQLVSV